MHGVIEGRIVHYVLTAEDVLQIARRRTSGREIRERLDQVPPAWPAGAQAHIGNPPRSGTHTAAMIVQVWSPSTVNLQVFLDGNDVLWVTSAVEGVGGDEAASGTWHEIERR